MSAHIQGQVVRPGGCGECLHVHHCSTPQSGRAAGASTPKHNLRSLHGPDGQVAEFSHALSGQLRYVAHLFPTTASSPVSCGVTFCVVIWCPLPQCSMKSWVPPSQLPRDSRLKGRTTRCCGVFGGGHPVQYCASRGNGDGSQWNAVRWHGENRIVHGDGELCRLPCISPKPSVLRAISRHLSTVVVSSCCPTVSTRLPLDRRNKEFLFVLLAAVGCRQVLAALIRNTLRGCGQRVHLLQSLHGYHSRRHPSLWHRHCIDTVLGRAILIKQTDVRESLLF